MLEVVEDGGFYINDYKLEMNMDEISRFDVDGNKQILNYLNDVKKMLEIVGVNKPMEIKVLSDKEENFIKDLVSAFVYERNLNFKEEAIPYVATMNFSNIKIVLVFEKNENGSYKLYNFFDKKCGFTVDSDGKIPTSQYTIFDRDDYLNISNMNLEVLINSYKEYENEPHISRVNYSILEMIHAYDIDNKRTDLLNAAQELSKWLDGKSNLNSVYFLNYLQCIRRKRELTNDEIKELNDISHRNSDNNQIQFGVRVLLDDFKSASMYLSEFAEEERITMISMPIYNLFKKKYHEL
jgi:hypothetical protein